MKYWRKISSLKIEYDVSYGTNDDEPEQRFTLYCPDGSRHYAIGKIDYHKGVFKADSDVSLIDPAPYGEFADLLSAIQFIGRKFQFVKEYAEAKQGPKERDKEEEERRVELGLVEPFEDYD